jgi:murein L,D-transpeptidase YcbB/YkuD
MLGMAERLSFEIKRLISMARDWRTLLVTSVLAGLAGAPALAQIAPMGSVPGTVKPTKPVPAPARKTPAPGARTAPDALAPSNPDFKPEVLVTQTPTLLPISPAVWDVPDADALLNYIGGVAKEGLDPTDYDPAGLQAAIQSGNVSAISAAANASFNKLSVDLALGHVRKPGRIDWWVADPDLNAAKQDALLRSALAIHEIPQALDGLLPTHPQYAALKAALAQTPATDEAKRDRIRLNMDRWRWLPRDLGDKYIIVNVPGFHATLVQDGVNRWKQRAIAGKLSTPTPQLNAMATGVILNPWWEVPKSIEHEAAGKRGFVPVVGPDGEIQRWRQPPGPSNALGQIKFVMPNSKAIYLHDTNARSRFNSDTRALSHGCVRTEHILDLATQLLGDDGGEWTPDKIEAALDSKKSVQANFVKSLPVYIVYFTSAALNDGRIVDYKDLYGRDAKAMAALHMKDGGASLAVPKDPDAAGQPAKTKTKPKPVDQVATR